MTRRATNGLTLLEVILASALSAVVMAALGGAIYFFMSQVRRSQSSIEQAQLARAVMRIIENDLQSAVWKSDIDFESVETLAADSLASGADGLSDLAEDAGIDPTPAADALAGVDNTTDLAASNVLPTTIGIYGNAIEMQVDISRVPRIDQYDPQFISFRDRQIGDIPSDIKTVTYFLLSPGVNTSGHGQIGSAAQQVPQFGLVRRELDRAVTQYALNEGDLSSLDASSEILAHEVSALEFRYYDGFEWYQEWDSEVMGGLPLAVDVWLAIRDQNATDALKALESGQATDQVVDESAIGEMYRRMIRIPIAAPIDPEADLAEDPLLSGEEMAL